MESIHLDYKPTSWPRCRHRRRVAEIPVNGRRRLCAEVFRDADNAEIVCLWPEVYEGRCWRQVGRAIPCRRKASK
jgi:hypothetical protein